MEDWRSIIARQDAAIEQYEAKRHAIEEQARVLKEQTQRREADTLTLALNAYKIKEKLEYIQKGVWKVGDIQEYEPTFLRGHLTSPEMYRRSPRSDLSEFYKNITSTKHPYSGYDSYCYSPSSLFKSGGYRLSFKYEDVGQGSDTNEWGIPVSRYEYIDDAKEASIAVWINIRDNMPWLINVMIDTHAYGYALGAAVGFADDGLYTGGILNVFLTDFPENVITEDSQLQLKLARDCEGRATKHKLPLELQQIGAKNVSEFRESRKASKPKSFWEKLLG